EFGSIGDAQDGLHPYTEAADLTSTFAGHPHPKNRVGAFRGHGTALARAVQVFFSQDHGDLATGIGEQLVGSVLHQLVDLTITVATLGDPTFTVGVFLNESSVDAIGFQNSLRLLEDHLQHGGFFWSAHTPCFSPRNGGCPLSTIPEAHEPSKSQNKEA